MENRFLEADDYLRRVSGQKHSGCAPRPRNGSCAYAGERKTATSSQSSVWSQPFSATDRTLVILIENGGVDLGIPVLVTKLLEVIPQSNLIPAKYKNSLAQVIHEKLMKFTDNLIETLELSINRYNASKPQFFGDVVTLRDGTSSYNDLKNKLLDLSRNNRIIDLFVLTHGSGDFISVPGGINSDRIRAMKTELGRPLSLRSVYMMNCVGSSLNQAWIDAGAKASSGAIGNNYLPEPSMFFFWQNWKAGQTFESAVTSAYRQTIALLNDVVRGFISSLPIPLAEWVASEFSIETFDFVRDSAPVIQGQRSVTISTDNLSFTQTMSSSLATTVLPLSVLRSLPFATAGSNGRTPARTVSAAGIDFIKGWEGFSPKVYNDPAGHCTVGYGTLLHTGNCDGRLAEQPYVNEITNEKATELLAQKAAEFQRIINDAVSVDLNPNQNDALVSFAYNVGGANFQKSTLLRLLNAGDYSAVPTELRKWTKARQNGKLIDLPGLVRRRAGEADLFQKPVAATAESLSFIGDSMAVAMGDDEDKGKLLKLGVPELTAKLWAQFFPDFSDVKLRPLSKTSGPTQSVRDYTWLAWTQGPKEIWVRYGDFGDSIQTVATVCAVIIHEQCHIVQFRKNNGRRPSSLEQMLNFEFMAYSDGQSWIHHKSEAALAPLFGPKTVKDIRDVLMEIYQDAWGDLDKLMDMVEQVAKDKKTGATSTAIYEKLREAMVKNDFLPNVGNLTEEALLKTLYGY